MYGWTRYRSGPYGLSKERRPIVIRAYGTAADRGWTSLAEGVARAREAVARALVLESDLAEGHSALGWIQMAYDWDWRGAEASFARAVALAPRVAAVLLRAGVLAMNLGRLDEAIGLQRRAIEQDPLSAGSYHNLALALDANGDFIEAEQAFRKALELAPQQTTTRAYLALTLLAQGRAEEALAEALREPEEWALWGSAIIEHAAGHPAAADATLRELIAKHAESVAYQIAVVYAAHGEADLAFTWLERAYAQRDPGLITMKSDRLLRPLNSDPRWGLFLRKMGLPE